MISPLIIKLSRRKGIKTTRGTKDFTIFLEADASLNSRVTTSQNKAMKNQIIIWKTLKVFTKLSVPFLKYNIITLCHDPCGKILWIIVYFILFYYFQMCNIVKIIDKAKLKLTVQFIGQQPLYFKANSINWVESMYLIEMKSKVLNLTLKKPEFQENFLSLR